MTASRSARALGATWAGRLVVAIVWVCAIATARADWVVLAGAGAVTVAVVVATDSKRRIAAVALPAAAAIAASVLPVLAAQGPLRASLVALRAALSVAIAVAIVGTIPAPELAPSLRGLGAPAALAAVLASTLRQAAVLREEGRRLLLARRLRGRTRYRDGAALAATLLARAASRAERVDLAMQLRGYTPSGAMARTGLARGDAPAVVLAAFGAGLLHAVGRLLP